MLMKTYINILYEQLNSPLLKLQNHMADFLQHRFRPHPQNFWVSASDWEIRICDSNKLPEVDDDAGTSNTDLDQGSTN